ncbi:hypothetical protein [Amycolatopsis sp. CA-126428]|uniref:hypothetical protein n=1 Tax=Amycolatopsis sp. CA-126428 TaxID=2073158 RepID=UPI000CD138E7|nr:hypothetical protein [Amycolatopsis sp. CA-126428]
MDSTTSALLGAAISWITWYAKHAPASVDAQMAGSYEQDNHAFIPKLQGALAVVASLSLTAYEELRPLVHRLFVLDTRTAVGVGIGVTVLFGRQFAI